MRKYSYIIVNMIIFAFSAALTALLIVKGISTYSGGVKDYPVSVTVLFCLAGILFSMFSVPFFHELGHLVFGLANDMAFYSMRIGFLVIYKNSGRLRIRFSGSEQAGMCEMVPKSGEKLYSRFLLMVAGGNIFTAVYLLISAVFFVLPDTAPALYFLLAAGLPVCFYFLALNILPAGVGFKTDGAIIAGLLKKDASSMATVNLLAVQSHYFMGKTPGEVERGLYFDIPDPDDLLTRVMLLNLRYIYYVDTSDLENAYETALKLENLSAGLAEHFRQNILSDALYEYSVNGENKKAEALFPELKKYLLSDNNATNLRIRAAYALHIENDASKARELVNRGLAESDESVISGIGRFEQKLLEALMETIRGRQAQDEEEIKRLNVNLGGIYK